MIMNELFTYLAEASVILWSLSLIYWLFFRKFTFYQLNRSLVLLIVIVALFMPLIQIDIQPIDKFAIQNLKVPEVSYQRVYQPNDYTITENSTQYASSKHVAKEGAIESQHKTDFDWVQITGILYLLGFVFMFFSLILSLLKFYKVKKTAAYCQNSQHYIIPEPGNSFSFFQWIFIDAETMRNAEYQVVLKHEKVHVCLLHSLDVILFELGKSILWFNPAIYLLAKESRLINEFHTDQMVADEEGLEVYSNTLINYQQNIFKRPEALLMSNSFALLSLKPRVMQLVKKPSKSRSKLSYLTLMPVLAILFIVISCEVTEEPHFGQNIKSVKAYYFDEYGDQQERNGNIMLDLELNPDGSIVSEWTTINQRSFLKSSLPFIDWNTEAFILEHNHRWPEIRKAVLQKRIDKHFTWESREGIVVDKDSPEPRRTTIDSRVVREKDEDGFDIIKVEEFDQDGKVWHTFTIDNGEAYEYDEKGRISAVRYLGFDDEAYMKSREKSLADINVGIDSRKFRKPIRFDFSYDENGNLITSRYNGKLSKSFQYDANNRLIKINRFKNEKLISYYLLNYNDKNHFSVVVAYNGTDGIEFTTKYEYQYY